MRWSVLFLLLGLAGCAPKFQPTSDASDTAMAQAEWDCQQQWRAAYNQHLAVNPQYGGVMGFKKRSFLIDCMRAKGYEVVQ